MDHICDEQACAFYAEHRMERLRKPAKEIEAQHHTLEEVSALLREGPVTIFSEASRNKLANSLQELSRYRSAAYLIRVSLAQVDKDKP